MAKQHVHREDCERLLGGEFTDVHLFLDELTDIYPVGQFGERHREHRHNSYGVELCREIWGDEAAKAAKIHIIRDWYDFHMEHLTLEELLELADNTLLKVDKYRGDYDESNE